VRFISIPEEAFATTRTLFEIWLGELLKAHLAGDEHFLDDSAFSMTFFGMYVSFLKGNFYRPASYHFLQISTGRCQES
jgi:hypothetical protein